MAQVLMNFQTQNHDFSNYGLKSVPSIMQTHLSAEWNVSVLKILWLSVLERFYVDIIFIAFYHIVGLIRLRYKSSTSNIIIVIINISSISSTLCSEKKHPLTFSFMSRWRMLRLPNNFQRKFRRKQEFHQWKS